MQLRNNIWKNTKERCIDYNPVVKAIKETYKENIDLVINKDSTTVMFFKEDTIFNSLRSVNNPLVLIFADDITPGGCVDSGNGMQEESIFRTTSIHKHLISDYYPIQINEVLYTPDIEIFTMPEDYNYSVLNNVYRSFIACPGIKMSSEKMQQEEIDVLTNKIRLIFQVAKKYNHKELVLGALGCGVYGCNPKLVAELFKKVINETSGFVVYFAILGKNYEMFKETFLQN